MCLDWDSSSVRLYWNKYNTPEEGNSVIVISEEGILPAVYADGIYYTLSYDRTLGVPRKSVAHNVKFWAPITTD